MTDIQLFYLSNGTATELPSQAVKLERDLQTLIESNMATCLGVRFLASEYKTGKTHRGRIDSLGLDENGCPVIIEYKRHSNENVINQGLFYLDWLLDHQAEFRWLVMETLGKDAADQIEWTGTRLLCIAADFTRYDEYAVQQIPRNIELLRYKLFGDDLLLLELVNSQSVPDATAVKAVTSDVVTAMPQPRATNGKDKSVTEWLDMGSEDFQTLYGQTVSYLNSLGDDVQEKRLKLYTAFRRLKNFACIVVQANRLLVTLAIDPATVTLEEGFSRDMTNVGHWGTGDLELAIRTLEDLERAKPLLERSYRES
ncbi:transporter [Gluconobacter frateurii NBRC 101659]|nr:transporter [Gluconobacter frateurii NBRC 101659]